MAKSHGYNHGHAPLVRTTFANYSVHKLLWLYKHMYSPPTLSHCHLVVQERGYCEYYLRYVWNVVNIIAATPAETESQRLACKQSYLPFSPSRYHVNKLSPCTSCKHTLRFQFLERILALHLGMLPARNMSYCYSSLSTL